jgi:hypothetical protein
VAKLPLNGDRENIEAAANLGRMPPHPTFYCRKKIFEELGDYKPDYGSAADYELMLRFIYFNKTNVYYLNKVTIKW